MGFELSNVVFLVHALWASNKASDTRHVLENPITLEVFVSFSIETETFISRKLLG